MQTTPTRRCDFSKCGHAPATAEMMALDNHTVITVCAVHAERVACLMGDIAPERVVVVLPIGTTEPMLVDV